jgi:thioredoxin reductase
MASTIARYTRWLHTGWPAGTVEPLPVVGPDGATAVPGLYVAGDLTGIPLLKFAADTGARAVQRIAADDLFRRRDRSNSRVRDLVIVGGGVAGVSAAIEARKHELDPLVIEASEPFATVVNFPKAKPIFTYPKAMRPAGDLQVTASVKEPLVDELRRQARDAGIVTMPARAVRIRRNGSLLEVELADGNVLPAHRVIVAIGRSGDFRKLGVPGETLDKVSNRPHDPHDFAGMDVLVGGGAALETAVAIAGGRVTLSYRKKAFSRPKLENVEAAGR